MNDADVIAYLAKQLAEERAVSAKLREELDAARSPKIEFVPRPLAPFDTQPNVPYVPQPWENPWQWGEGTSPAIETPKPAVIYC